MGSSPKRRILQGSVRSAINTTIFVLLIFLTNLKNLVSNFSSGVLPDPLQGFGSLRSPHSLYMSPSRQKIKSWFGFDCTSTFCSQILVSKINNENFQVPLIDSGKSNNPVELFYALLTLVRIKLDSVFYFRVS